MSHVNGVRLGDDSDDSGVSASPVPSFDYGPAARAPSVAAADSLERAIELLGVRREELDAAVRDADRAADQVVGMVTAAHRLLDAAGEIVRRRAAVHAPEIEAPEPRRVARSLALLLRDSLMTSSPANATEVVGSLLAHYGVGRRS